MGFLRKLGKKIKKGVKKLFKSKIGRILGGIGLSLMFYGGAEALFGQTQWWKNMQAGLNRINPFAKNDLTSAVKKVAPEIDPTKVAGDAIGKEQVLIETADAAKTVADTGSKTLLDRTKDFFTPDGGKRIKEYVGKDFIPDVTRSVVTNVAMDAVAGTPEQPFVGGGIMPTPVQEQAQAAYMADLNTAMPQSGIQNFQQAQQSLLYGTLSPFYLQEQARMYS